MNLKFGSFWGFLSGMLSYSTATLTNLASRLIGTMSSESVLHHLVCAQGTNCIPLWKTISNHRRNIEGYIITFIWNNTNPWCVMPKRQITNLMLRFPMKHPNMVVVKSHVPTLLSQLANRDNRICRSPYHDVQRNHSWFHVSVSVKNLNLQQQFTTTFQIN